MFNNGYSAANVETQRASFTQVNGIYTKLERTVGAMQEICNTALPLDTNPLVRKIKCEDFPLRGKQGRTGMGVRDEMEEEFGVKARSTSPEHSRMDHGGNGFWLAAVAGGAPHPMLDACETGFINSQPSMAEFMTALPQLGTGELSPQRTPPGYPADLPSPSGGLGVPEYPWMKEKKTTRKNSQQGQ